MVTITIEWGEGEDGHLECHQDVDEETTRKILELLGVEFFDVDFVCYRTHKGGDGQIQSTVFSPEQLKDEK